MEISDCDIRVIIQIITKDLYMIGFIRDHPLLKIRYILIKRSPMIINNIKNLKAKGYT